MDTFAELLKKWKPYKLAVREYILPFNPLTEFEQIISESTLSYNCEQSQGRSDLWRFKFEVKK